MSIVEKIKQIFTETYKKMNTEQDLRLANDQSGFFPYHFMADRLNEIETGVLKILEEEEMKIWTNNFETLAIQAKTLGFNHVDIYVPDKKTEETVAFTFSKSEEYIKIIQNVEVGKVVVEREKLQHFKNWLESLVVADQFSKSSRLGKLNEKFVELFGEMEKEA